ncbi:MerR family transcriptional regulator [Aneurinibacillus sp. Ricciae_BoGa-3]|uniref:MerR family transcriptional regulator n=1 Tax=Aneurinibacillus sp. Ricciae_BoGa-3 TaxID=3022697 RepID=UPI0023417C81|nr:MerR family transcriptional regulator [Aneurinibacillus sp. Ricciae_BoGa-3]WCK55657.1 MerR family transcriptional regulator [Aneurinibacillus sp. Ricciae_BoGa-3]
MDEARTQFYQTGEFAQKAGVTVRTLRYYDQAGLLVPSHYTEAGHRLYSQEDFVLLQQILTLKFIGLSLEQIRIIFQEEDFDVAAALKMQREVIEEKKRQLELVIKAINEAEDSVRHELKSNKEKFIKIIEVIQMEKNIDWIKRYYSEEQLEALAKREYSPEQQKADTKRWQDLIEEVKQAVNSDPASPQAQDLAVRWLALIEEFTQGDPGLLASLQNMYADREQMPTEFKPYDDEVQTFIQKALNIYKERSSK